MEIAVWPLGDDLGGLRRRRFGGSRSWWLHLLAFLRRPVFWLLFFIVPEVRILSASHLQWGRGSLLAHRRIVAGVYAGGLRFLLCQV